MRFLLLNKLAHAIFGKTSQNKIQNCKEVCEYIKSGHTFEHCAPIDLFTLECKMPISDHVIPLRNVLLFKYLHMKESTPKSTITWSEMGTTMNAPLYTGIYSKCIMRLRLSS